jgi:hypothetical protein
MFSKAMERYIKGDLEMTRDLWEKRKPLTNNQIGDICQEAYDRFAKKDSKIVKVIFNDPATIVFWRDNTKTVVKCDPTEQFDPEKGLAMAIAKKALGNKGNYFNEIKKWTESYKAECKSRDMEILDDLSSKGVVIRCTTTAEAMEKLKDALGLLSPSEKCGFNKED